MPELEVLTRAELEPLVRSALRHLYDPERLEMHQLTQYLPEVGDKGSARQGRMLQRALIDAIEALRSRDAGVSQKRTARGYELLSLRYVEALEITAVRGRLAVSRSQYHADHRRAVSAVTSLLWQRWRCAQRPVEPTVDTPPLLLSGLSPSTNEESERRLTNLPAELTSFVGRRRQLAEVERLLRATRLLTLTGAGGCGKTRLALRVARDRCAAYSDGVWLVDLAPLAASASESTDLVASAAAVALGLARSRQQSALAGLVRMLSRRRLLLVLDNCEHVMAACARLADAVLRECPGVRILATSREPLRTAGEVVCPVPPLSIPAIDAPVAVAYIVASEAGRLFAERAAAALPGFAITPQTATAVTRICRRLDGLPLAIELAAAWVRSLGPDQIEARVSGRLDLLAAWDRTMPPRHQTLRKTLEWSHALLARSEQVLLRRLAVFAGGWSLEAAEEVCTGDDIGMGQVLGLVASLVDRSLIVAEALGGVFRYRLLETIRQYAAENLTESGEESAVRTRHREWCLALSHAACSELSGPRHAAAVARLALEHDNLLAALTWCLDCQDGTAGLQLATNLCWYWVAQDHLADGCRWLDLFAALVPQPIALRGRALSVEALLERFTGNAVRSLVLGEQAAAIARAIGDESTQDEAEVQIALAEASLGDFRRARTRLEACLDRARAREDVLAVRDRTRDLGLVHMADADFTTARALFIESLVLARQTGNDGMAAMALMRLAALDRLQGDLSSARTRLEEAWALAHMARAALDRFRSSLGSQARAESRFAEAEAILNDVLVRSHARGDHLVAAEQLCSLGVLRIAQGRFADGVELIGVGVAVSPVQGTIHTPDLRLEIQSNLARARAMLSENSFARAWSAGQAKTTDEYLIRGTLRPPIRDLPGKRRSMRSRRLALPTDS